MSTTYIVGYTPDGEKVITLFSPLTFIYDDDNEYVKYFGAQSGDNIDQLESIDGMTIKISDLQCKSYEEVLVQMDVYNLLHSKDIPDEICNEICTTSTKTNNTLKKKVKELAEENRRLKLKLKQLKNLIDK